MMRAGQFKILAATAAMSVAVGLGTPLMAFAATGTVNGSNTNVRSDASTGSSIVGTADSGDEFELGDSKDGDDGHTWYQVTLDDGSTGYIRDDLMTITEDAPAEDTEETPAEDTEETPVDETTNSGTETTTQTGSYQVVLAKDDSGNEVYYLYDNDAGKRMKISDIEALQTRLSEAEANVASVGNRYRILIIALAALLVLALVGCVTLFIRLRDAMTNGRRERDLTRDRANERRKGGSADDLSAVKRRTREDRRASGASRSNAYASGTRRRPASGEGRPARDDRRSSEDYPRAREGARPVRQGNDGQRETARRPMSDERRAPQEMRRERPVRPAGDEDVRTSRVRTDRPVRSEAQSGETQSQPRNSAPQNAAPARTASRPQAKNFADDDDFDYGFINLDDQ